MQQLEPEVKGVSHWWHSIDLGHGIITPGHKTPETLTHELESMHLPDLRGKSVLDIGAWDGFFSFDAERRGASRVVSLDHYIWSIEPGEAAKYVEECKRRGVTVRYEDSPKAWRPDLLPGKRGYDIAHKALRSKAECRVVDFMTLPPGAPGVFDVVYFMGVLYHMENPLAALKWLASVTGGLAIIETAAVALPGHEDHALAEFYEGEELNGDPTNWWAPNRKALEAMCRAAGFAHVEVVAWPWDRLEALPPGIQRGRCVAHACRKMPALPYVPHTIPRLRRRDFKAGIRVESPRSSCRPTAP